ncbi:MAG: 3-phosphoshikimate 1-carboxyvinyltransferase, partial [Acidimicrobiales bacterium]
SMLARGTVVIDGAPPLRRRPIGALVSSLRSLGASVTSTSGRAPISVRAPGLVGGEVSVDAGESSQFATALLLVAPCAERDLTLRVSNLSAGGYVALTLEAMRRFGAFVSDLGGGRYEVSAAGRYRGRREPVEYDASSAAHLFSLAMATGGDVTVTNAAPSLQPDASVVDHLAAMGARVDTPAAGGLRVRAPSVLAPIQADLSGMPDQLPTLAVLAALAPGRSRISGLAVSRGHETDRVAAVARELSKLGVGTETGPDWIEITGGKRLGPGIVETYEDHRMAMAFSALGAGAPGIVILDPSCITKTYPGFLDDAGSLGLGVRLAR